MGTVPKTGFSAGISLLLFNLAGFVRYPLVVGIFLNAGNFKFSAVVPYDVSEIVASSEILPSWGRYLLEYEVSICRFVAVSMAASDDEHVTGCMLEFLSRLLFL